MIPHNRLTFGSEEVQAVADVVESGSWSGGPQVKLLEQTLARLSGRTGAVCVGSGLGAIRLALLCLDINAGEEVIVPAYSCVSLANAVLSIGARPIPVDVSRHNWNVDLEAVAKARNDKTKAIIAVHTFGALVDIDRLKILDLPVIEDCAHALGLTVNGKPVGGQGDIAVCSFYATKLLGGGEGGAVLTNDESQDHFVRQWRDCNNQPPSPTRLNDKMNDLEAALVCAQIERLDTLVESRQELARRYDGILQPMAEETNAFYVPEFSTERIWYRYIVEMRDLMAVEVIQQLRDFNVRAESPVINWVDGICEDEFPVSNCAWRHIVSLPLFPTLTEAEQDHVCSSFEKILR